MNSVSRSDFNYSPVYRQAIEILNISRHISNYVVQDLAILKQNGKEDQDIYFSGDIIQQSTSLMPHILRAESEPFAEEKHKYAASVTRLTNLLYKNCERLELSNSNGREFIRILRFELKKFRKLQRIWKLTL
ncbi:hypothetical protein JM83_0574 [Gillisia sp. Hel_I_86]|uniref:hypothetical protein n=1 Tax=Gillisia sp. Hel_I_86 TaxID=1249981 RepID=UPI00119BB3D5|nr:hypothetical protein [Gillisia sp. Hel_I_86]TVZ25648.1 hypothetical protein JM83_0574 [Gillisia sp. Hel_I_86]